jgi:restriction endonuclease S subunit
MLDFSRKDFNKQISLTSRKSLVIESKWELLKISALADVIAGQSPDSNNYNEIGNGLAFYQGKKDFGSVYLKEPIVWTTQTTKESIKNDVLISVRAPVGDVNINPFDKICIGRGLAAIRSKNIITQRFIFEFIDKHKNLFKGNQGLTFDSISTADLSEIKIPLPPKDVQEKIVAECGTVDRNVEKANDEILATKSLIEKNIQLLFSKNIQEKKINEIALINPSKSELKNVDENTTVSFIEMASVSDEGYILHKVDRSLAELKKGSYTYFRDGDIIIAKITPCMVNAPWQQILQTVWQWVALNSMFFAQSKPC